MNRPVILLVFAAALGPLHAQSSEPADVKRRRAEAMKGLREDEWDKQIKAAFALHRLGAAVEDLPELVRMLKDEDVDFDVKSEIAYGLARLGPKAAPAADALFGLLSIRDDSAKAALIAIGPAAAEPIAKRLRLLFRDPDNQQRLFEPGLVEALLHIGGPAALRAEPELSDFQLFDALAFLGDPDAPADLAAQREVANFGPRNHEVPIRPEHAARCAASFAHRMRWCPNRLGDVEDFLASSVLPTEMACLGPAALPELRKLLHPKVRPFTRILALRSLELMGPISRPALEEIIHCLRSREVRRYALRAVAAIGPGAEDALPDVIDCLDDPDEHIREMAIAALVRLGPLAVDALPALERLAAMKNDPLKVDGVPVHAAVAIWRIAGRPEPFARLALEPERDAYHRVPTDSYDAGIDAITEAVRRKPEILAGAPPSVAMLMWLPQIARRFDPVPPALRDYAVRGLNAPWPDLAAAAVATLELIGPDAVRAHSAELFEVARRPVEPANPDFRAQDAAVLALLKVGDRRALTMVRKRIRKGEPTDVWQFVIACGPAARPWIPDFVAKCSTEETAPLLPMLIDELGAVALPHMLEVLAKNNGKVPERWGRCNPIAGVDDPARGPVRHGGWLLRQWLVERDESVRSAVHWLRERIKIDDASIPLLVRDLGSPNGNRRFLAVELLKAAGPRAKPATPALVRMLTDADLLLRLSAGRALTAIGEPVPEAVGVFRRWMTSKDDLERRVASTALAALAPRTPGLADLLIESGVPVQELDIPAGVPLRDEHFEALAMMRADQVLVARAGEARAALPALIDRFREDPKEVSLASVLAAVGRGAAVPVLIEALDSHRFIARREAARALGSLRADAKAAVPALRALLDDPQDWTSAMDALSHIDPAAAAVALPKLMKFVELDNDNRFDSAGDDHPIDAIALLIRLGPAAAPAVAVMTRRLHDIRWRSAPGPSFSVPEVPSQVAAMRVLASVGPKAAAPAIPALKALLNAEVAELRVEAARALVRPGAGGKGAVEALREVARGQAVGLPGSNRMPIPPGRQDRANAIELLIELSDPSTVEICRAIVTHEGFDTLRQPELAMGTIAARALARLGASARVAIPALRRHANDPDSPMRFEARKAIEAILR